jgi:hypothetical protein
MYNQKVYLSSKNTHYLFLDGLKLFTQSIKPHIFCYFRWKFQKKIKSIEIMIKTVFLVFSLLVISKFVESPPPSKYNWNYQFYFYLWRIEICHEERKLVDLCTINQGVMNATGQCICFSGKFYLRWRDKK